MKPNLIITQGWDDYRLLDSGEGRKLERVGPYIIDRPEPQAMWCKKSHAGTWDKADAVFVGATGSDEDSGRWRFKNNKQVPPWSVKLQDVKFSGSLTSFRHVGYFPEQLPHWEWMQEQISARKTADYAPKILNLFAYTGVASLLAASVGAQVTHVDSSKKSIGWAKDNQALSNLSDKSIRWICEDARKFVAREVRRGSKYDGILLDPPKFGRGTEDEVWNLFDDLPDFMRDIGQILNPDTGFLILTAYAIRASYLSFYELTRDVLGDRFEYDCGELAIQEYRQERQSEAGRLLGTSLYVRAEPKGPA